ncbi:WDGH domain-containing protein [Enterococcus sp. AZ109]|uniref:WDGH domain-containing protein n=1 Tax=Enterococcus sp. AZ109 TaxID=2774634 RepID=UPI003F28B1B2
MNEVNLAPEMNEIIKAYRDTDLIATGDISDTHHTFDELYEHRCLLFSVICNLFPDKAWKSKLHDDGTMFDGMFIVGVETPLGMFTYHYELNCWDMFHVTELEKGHPWDGHTPKDIVRLNSLLDSTNKSEKRIDKALDIAFEWSRIDGDHHKMWAIDQMVRELTGENYEEWVSTYESGDNGEKEYEWDAGIAP